MKYSEFRKWLPKQGATFKSAKGSHFRVYLNGRQSTFPDHGATEIGVGLVVACGFGAAPEDDAAGGEPSHHAKAFQQD